MAPQRDPSTFRGGVVKDLSAGAVAAAGVTVALYFAQLTPPNEVVLAMQVLGTVLLGLLRRAGEELLARRGGGGSGTAALGSIVALAAILSVVGCTTPGASASGEVSQSEGVVKGTGGTFACQKGYGSHPLPDGSAIPGSCAEGLVWTDPPTTEETNAWVKAVEAVMKPVEILANALARIIPGAPAPAP